MLRAALIPLALLYAAGIAAADTAATADAAAAYRKLFAEVEALLDDLPFAEDLLDARPDPEALAAVSPEQRRQMRAALAPAMAKLPALAQAGDVDWGVHKALREAGFNEATLPHVGSGMRLLRAAQWYGRETFDDDPQAAIDLLVSSAATARHLNSEPFLLSHLVQNAGEGLLMDSIAELAPKMTAEQRSALLQVGEQLPRRGALLEALRMERELAIGALRNDLAREGRKLREDLGPGEVASFPGDLRLAGIRQTGDAYPSINLENTRSGANFWLTRGRTLHGIRIDRVDLEAGRAWIRKGDRLALIDLERETLEDRHVPWEVIEAVLGDPMVFAHHSDLDGRAALEEAGITPDTVLDLIDDMDRLFLEYIDALQHSPGAVAALDKGWQARVEANPLARVMMPSLQGTVASDIRHFRRLEAVELGLEILNGDTDPDSLVRSYGNYRYEPRESGFDIVAVFERDDEPGYRRAPVKVSFGPPDAGPGGDPSADASAGAGAGATGD